VSFDPARKPEAHYQEGLAWLGVGELSRARAAFKEAGRTGSPRRAQALLGVALSWERGERPERAIEALDALLAGDPGEAGPAALEQQATLATRLDRPETARRARARLLEEYPLSLEAVRAATVPALPAAPAARSPSRPHVSTAPASPGRPAPPPGAVQGPLAVQIGVFRDAARARALADRARRAGFSPVRVSAREDAAGALYAVRIGLYATAEDARAAGRHLDRALGVSARVVPAP
jgi:tetratricopeptide (TPR) repeat protein